MSVDIPAVKRTPLEAEHRALGARLGPFAGWLMPIEYEGTLAEHRAVREAAGLFDLTHLGKVMVEGEGAGELLQGVLTNDLSKVAVGAAQYNLVLNQRGGIVDDLIVYRLEESRYLVVPNAANTTEVHGILREHATGRAQAVLREDLALVALQGPASLKVIDQVFPEATGLEYMHVTGVTYRGEPAVLSRSGYTGELGFELFVPEGLAFQLWVRLTSLGEPVGLRPAGLGARDTLRLEMGYPLHGNDISPERTPLEAGLGWAVALDKGEFPGREALLAEKREGIPARLWGLRMNERGRIPRAHYPVLAGGEQAGETTSGSYSPSLGIGIALAYLFPRDRFRAGNEVDVDIRGRRAKGEVVRPPFVDSSPR